MGAMFQLTRDLVRPEAGAAVVKRDEAAVMLEAGTLLDEARRRAAEIAEEAESAYEEQRRKGYEEGLEKGRLEQSEKMMDIVLSSVEFIETIERTVVDVVKESVRKVVGDLGDDERIVRVVRTALDRVRNQRNVVVRVAPDDESAVRKSLAGLLQGVPGSPAFMSLTPDARLGKGSCVIESELGIIDAGLETQLKALEHAFGSRIKS